MSKDLSSTATTAVDSLDAAVSADLVQVHLEDTEMLRKEGIDYRQQGQKTSVEDLLRQSLNMQRELVYFITIMEATPENANEATKTRLLDVSVLKAVLNSTKDSAEVPGVIHDKNYINGIETRNIKLLEEAIRPASQET